VAGNACADSEHSGLSLVCKRFLVDTVVIHWSDFQPISFPR
jgi:hypothetical protein